MVLRPNVAVVIERFFPLFISSDYFLDAAIKISVGSLSPTINWSALKELEFNLPSLDEQDSLAEVLWAIIDTKNAYKRLISLTDQLVKSRFVEMFGGGEFDNEPIEAFVDGSIEKVGRKYEITDEIRYIDISSIDNAQGEIVNYSNYIVANAPSRAQQVVRKGDVLVSTVRPNLRNVAVIKDDWDNLVASTGFCVLRPNSHTRSEYLYAIVSTESFAEHLSGRAKGANYPAVNASDIKGFMIPKAPLSLQARFATFAEAADKSRFDDETLIRISKYLPKNLAEPYRTVYNPVMGSEFFISLSCTIQAKRCKSQKIFRL